MKTEPNNESNHDSDRDVKRAYLLYSKETVPDELNRAILREAKSGMQTPFLSRIYSWRRPLAFAATLVLGVTLVYDMQTVLRVTDTPLMPFSTTNGKADQVSGDAVLESPTEEMATDSALETRDVSRDDSAVQMNHPAPVASGANKSLNRKASRDRDHDQGAAAARILEEKAERPVAKFEAISRDSISAPARAIQVPASEATTSCNEKRYESAALWWRCVQELRAAGDDAAANTEWQRLETEYPDFRMP